VPPRLKTGRSRGSSAPSDNYEIPLDPDWEFPRDRWTVRKWWLDSLMVRASDLRLNGREY